jgi:hypothetical protein
MAPAGGRKGGTIKLFIIIMVFCILGGWVSASLHWVLVWKPEFIKRKKEMEELRKGTNHNLQILEQMKQSLEQNTGVKIER